jgi:hypothetical protein
MDNLAVTQSFKIGGDRAINILSSGDLFRGLGAEGRLLPLTLGQVVYHQQKTTLTLSKSLKTHYLKALTSKNLE